MVFPVMWFVKCFTGADLDSQASSPRSTVSSKYDYDWDAIDEERREHLLWWWHRRHRVLIRGQYFFRVVLRTWRQLCSIDAEITDAMYQRRLLRNARNAFVAWRCYQRQLWTLRSRRLRRRATNRSPLDAFNK